MIPERTRLIPNSSVDCFGVGPINYSGSPRVSPYTDPARESPCTHAARVSPCTDPARASPDKYQGGDSRSRETSPDYPHGDLNPHVVVSDSLDGRPILYRAITEDGLLIDSHPYLRKMALISCFAVSVISGLLFAPVSLELPAGYLFAAANFLGFLKLYMWASRNIIHELLGPTTEAERILIERARPGKCVVATAVTASIALALFSQLPNALPVLDYDGKLKVFAFISLLLGGSLLSIRSLQLSLQKMAQKKEQTRTTLVSMVETHLKTFQEMDPSLRSAHVSRLNADPAELIKEVFKESSESKVSPAVLALGLWIALSFQVATAIYTFEETKTHMVDKNVAAGAMAFLAVASGAHLSSQSIMESAQAFYEMLVEGKRTIAEQLHPEWTRPLKILGSIVDAGALGACFRIWEEFYKDNMPAKVYFEITVCLAFFFFLSSSTLALSYELAGKTGDDKEKLIIGFTRKLENIKRLIQQASKEDLDDFIQRKLNPVIGASTVDF